MKRVTAVLIAVCLVIHLSACMPSAEMTDVEKYNRVIQGLKSRTPSLLYVKDLVDRNFRLF